MSYLEFPFAETAEAATQRILAGLAARLPGYVPVEGALEVALAEEIGREVSDLRRLAVDVAAGVVRSFGQSLFGVPYRPGSPAAVTVRVSSSTQGVTIPAGFTAVGTTLDGVDVAFVLPADSKLASNASSKTVTLIARDAGAFGNGVPVGPLTVATATPSITAVTAETTPSAGGSDPEIDEQYLDRLSSTLALYNRTAVRGEDFAVLATDVPGVYRALALDLYDPDTGATDAARTVTVVPIDEDGYPVPPAVADAVDDLLESTREVNFIVKTMAPTYVQLQVAFTATALPGQDVSVVRAAIVERAYAVLDPGAWGGGTEEPPVWRDARTVRYLDFAAELDRVDGVDHIDTLTINGTAGDYVMSGVAPLPAPRAAASPTIVSGSVS